MNKEKKFIIPQADVVKFYSEDIILTSDVGGIDYPWWSGDNPGFPGNPVNH